MSTGNAAADYDLSIGLDFLAYNFTENKAYAFATKIASLSEDGNALVTTEGRKFTIDNEGMYWNEIPGQAGTSLPATAWVEDGDTDQYGFYFHMSYEEALAKSPEEGFEFYHQVDGVGMPPGTWTARSTSARSTIGSLLSPSQTIRFCIKTYHSMDDMCIIISPTSQMSIPFDGFVVCILNAGTYLTKTTSVTGQTQIMADDVQVFTDRSLKEPLVSRLPMTTVRTLSESEDREQGYTGYLQSSSSDVATLSTEVGTFTTKYRNMTTEAYPTHTFGVDGTQTVRLQVHFDDALSYEIPSRVLQVTDTAYVIEQQLRITNKLPFDITNAPDLLISFQRRSRYVYEMGASAQALMAKSAETKEVINEVAAPLSMGPIKQISQRSTITFNPLPPITLEIVGTFVDITLGSKTATSSLDLINRGSTRPTSPRRATSMEGILYPSTVMIMNDFSVPVATMQVGLQVPGSRFETNLGLTTSVSVLLSETTDTEYKVKVQSNVDKVLTIRISGWELRGRVDTHKLSPRSTQMFTGRLPPDRRS